MTSVLVAVASKYGATEEIASEIGRVLSDRGVETAVRRVEQPTNVDEFDAVVLGSAVYAGHWLKEARDFVEANRQALSSRPVWLFSSGPIGDPPMPREDPVDVAGLVAATLARGHRVFAGKLDRKRLNFFERAIVVALRAPEGDYRDWAAIRAWAGTIADELMVTATRQP